MLLKYLLVCARNRKVKGSLCSEGIDLNTVMGKWEWVYGLQGFIDKGVC